MNKILRFLLLIMMGLVFSIELPAQSHYRPLKERKAEKKEIVVATWNIGHYANGSKPYSLIEPKQIKDKQKAFRTMIYDSLSADLIGINEFSPVFGKEERGKEVLSSKALFNKYRFKKEGTQSWISNSIYSQYKFENVEKSYFNCSKSFKPKDPRATLFNYLSADASFHGVKVKIVLVHLISRQPKLCQLQIEELIAKYKTCDKIIMFGDWNTWNWSKFKKAGYSLANNGSLITFPSKSYALDNVIVKGLEISDVKVVKTDLSDHYPLVCRITVK